MTPSETFVTLPVIRTSGLAAANNLVVFAVVTNPKPDDVIPTFHSHGAIMNPDARRPVASDFFEMQRGMARVVLEPFKVFIGEPLDGGGQLRAEIPEFFARPVFHNSWQRPALKSASASSASASSFPARTSAANCLSQAAASNS